MLGMSAQEWIAIAAGTQAIATITLVAITALYVKRVTRQADASEKTARIAERSLRLTVSEQREWLIDSVSDIRDQLRNWKRVIDRRLFYYLDPDETPGRFRGPLIKPTQKIEEVQNLGTKIGGSLADQVQAAVAHAEEVNEKADDLERLNYSDKATIAFVDAMKEASRGLKSATEYCDVTLARLREQSQHEIILDPFPTPDDARH